VGVLIRQLFESSSCTWTWLVACERSGEAVLIDPVFEKHSRDLALIRELGLELRLVLDTHCHADHVTGAWRMRAATGCAIGLAEAVGASGVDLPLRHGMELRLGDLALEVRATPGHTDGCLSYVTASRSHAFTGDALLIRGAGRTDFQQGDAARLYRSIQEQLFSLPDATLVCPAHDYDGRTISTIGEERRFNPRIGGQARVEDFVGYMDNLGLPHPRLMDIAVPANLRSGEPAEGELAPEPSWGPVFLSYAGLPEIEAEWVSSHRQLLTLLDVRQPGEWQGELPAVAGARCIPLDQLRARAHELERDRPVALLCQSGRRSALATSILLKAGWTEVANVRGGMLRWRELGLPG
jgi:glyoxylase-like metal-dependent hydrolase (beta-lactamase superfamily II)/rhodanese-related sulfurtransferase